MLEGVGIKRVLQPYQPLRRIQPVVVIRQEYKHAQPPRPERKFQQSAAQLLAFSQTHLELTRHHWDLHFGLGIQVEDPIRSGHRRVETVQPLSIQHQGVHNQHPCVPRQGPVNQRGNPSFGLFRDPPIDNLLGTPGIPSGAGAQGEINLAHGAVVVVGQVILEFLAEVDALLNKDSVCCVHNCLETSKIEN